MPPAKKTRLFETTTSDDESDEWNLIVEKMKRRPAVDANDNAGSISSSSNSKGSDTDSDDEKESGHRKPSAMPPKKPVVRKAGAVAAPTAVVRSSRSTRIDTMPSDSSPASTKIIAKADMEQLSPTPLEMSISFRPVDPCADDCFSTADLPDEVLAAIDIDGEAAQRLSTTPVGFPADGQPGKSNTSATTPSTADNHHRVSSKPTTGPPLSTNVKQTDNVDKECHGTNPYAMSVRRSRADKVAFNSRPPMALVQPSTDDTVNSSLDDSNEATPSNGPPAHPHQARTMRDNDGNFPELTDEDWAAVDLSLAEIGTANRSKGLLPDGHTIARASKQSRGEAAEGPQRDKALGISSTLTVRDSTRRVGRTAQSSPNNPYQRKQGHASQPGKQPAVTLVPTLSKQDVSCEYEFASSDEYCAETSGQGDQTPFQTERDDDSDKFDVFGFEIKPETPPTDNPLARTLAPVETCRGHRDQTIAPPDEAEMIDIDEIVGFSEQSVPLTNDNPRSAFGGPIQSSAEVDPSQFPTRPWDITLDPIIHRFTKRNRPVELRKTLPVSQVFDAPVSKMWTTKFSTFNQLQSEVANMLAHSDDNVVVSAPTGAGKTAVFEQAIARFFAVDLQNPSSGKPQISKARKMVYVSPSKALIEERFADWSNCLSRLDLGIEIAVVTGDGDPADSFYDIASAHFILTTPEKWDSLTRRWTESFVLFASVKLFMVDEVHLLADGTRGCCLEATVCRMKAIQWVASQVVLSQADIARSGYPSTTPEAVNSLLRFVAVSATLPNIEDVAKFFEANEAHTFDESYRPVPLTTHVIGQGKIGDASKDRYFFWQNLDRNVPELIFRYSNGRPAIVFCHSKNDCEKLADLLAVCKNIGRRDNTSSEMAAQTRVSKLQRVLLHGIAYHHAGLEVEDRRLVERSFASGKIRVICATSTIAMGVNLPAHLVVVKGTSAWRGAGEGGGYQDIDQATLLQMIGRAGRPGFDDSGTAVIMTDNDSKPRFENLASKGLDPCRSQMQGDRLVESINANVSQRVISGTESAISWLKGTLYYIQLVHDPAMHGIKVVSEFSVDTHLMGLYKTAVEQLAAIHALSIADGQEIHPLPASHVMSHRLVEYKTMEHITTLPFDLNQRQLLKAISEIEGLHRPVRRNEKKALNAAHKSLRLYKLDGPLSKARVQEPWEKAFVLLQAYVEELELEGNDYALRQEMNSIVDFATRMLSAIEDYSLNGSKHGNIIVQSLKLRRSIAVHLWSANDGVLRQIKGIGKSQAFTLHLGGISTFDDVLKSSQEQVEKAAGRASPFGGDLRRACASILQRALKVSVSISQSIEDAAQNILSCSVAGNSDTVAADSGIAPVSYSLIAHSDRAGGCILFKDNITRPGVYTAPLPLKYGKVTIHLIASLIGLDDKVELPGNDCAVSPSGPEAQTRPVAGKRARDFTRNKSAINKPPQRPKLAQERDRAVARIATGAPGRASLLGGIEATVTPSPKPWSTAASQHSSDYSGIAPTFSQAAHHHEDRGYDHLPLQGASWSNQHDVMSSTDSRLHGRFYDAYSTAAEPTAAGPLQRSSAVESNTTTDRFSNRVASWKATKRLHQKSQERGFAQKKDNPFSVYKHDPNDSELNLDHLTVRNKEAREDGIVPPEGFLALARAERHRARSGIPLAQGNGAFRRPTDHQSTRRSSGGTLRDILAQKADERRRLSACVPSAHNGVVQMPYLQAEGGPQHIGHMWTSHGTEARYQPVQQVPTAYLQHTHPMSTVPFSGIVTGAYYSNDQLPGPIIMHPQSHQVWPQHRSTTIVHQSMAPDETYMQLDPFTEHFSPDSMEDPFLKE